jgi:hypothetical protein
MYLVVIVYSMWSLYGVYVESTWSSHGVPTQMMTNLSLHRLHIDSMWSTWSPRGVYKYRWGSVKCCKKCSHQSTLLVTGICMFLSSLFLFFHMYYLIHTIYGSSRILPRCDLMSRAHTLHSLNFTSFVQHTCTCTQYIRVQCSASRAGLVKHLITLYRHYTFLHFSQVQPFHWTTVQFQNQQTSTLYPRIST